MRRYVYALLAVLGALAPSCNLFNDLGNSWCGTVDNAGGSDDGSGVGGDTGAGGDTGVGGDTGAGGDTIGTGAGGDSTIPDMGAGAAPGARPPPHWRRPHARERLGVARLRDCGDQGQPVNVPPPPPPPPPPSWQGLTTTKLRSIAIGNNSNGCANQTGIQQNRTIGVAFEAWVLKTMGQLPRWNKLLDSPERQKKTGGLPGSVIPEFVGDQTGTLISVPSMSVSTVYFPKSVFFEVKAVTGALTKGTSNWQILGLLDVAQIANLKGPSQMHPPAAVFFTTTGNTTIAASLVADATTRSVAVWQQKVLFDANSTTPNDPALSLGDEECLNPGLYAGWNFSWIAPGPFPSHPLTWATPQDQASVVVPGDPDPAEVQ
jgi:hypothetical protein